ncbi:type IV secretion system protein [Asticcacaulis sp. EMRT-3]|uniref:virB8 family protein n=1 Tax=Asticcacaulis sp. EMRT-3 TaxID=3040349 RepID=UPI0024AF8229|nr:type IV secretion system protein [Asticcacaulis sp. EMRT-3]MDI7776572.1 type IV secretion system protein [Asticcacaulis sp. EMRT-3]
MFEKPAAVSPNGETAFYGQARDWEADRQARLEQSERRAWRVAVGACVVAILAVIGIATMAPFKRTVPYVFEVDKATGNTELVDAVGARTTIGYQELLDKHWAQVYVIARESYMYRLLQTDYDTTLGLSTDEVARGYAKTFTGPNALDTKLGASTEIRVTILSITLSQDSVSPEAVVRFEKTTNHLQSGISDPPQVYVATLAYDYKPSMFGKEKDLINNPLGYAVTSYRVDPEIATSTEAQPPEAQ